MLEHTGTPLSPLVELLIRTVLLYKAGQHYNTKEAKNQAVAPCREAAPGLRNLPGRACAVHHWFCFER